ncbi:MAG: hypothetical protein PWQ11_558 [Candidatus Diapherotrites archaeon]|nr:hypothetical protein [Candidatus Diapherotrites archaeon]
MGWEKHVWNIDEREERSEMEAAYIAGLVRWMEAKLGEKYRTILDVPCGNGRLHPYLKKMGFEVEGIDISEELVRDAREKGLKCWQGDMADPKAYPDKEYDVILNWFTSFGYGGGENDEKILKIWHDHLRKGGLLIIDTVVPSGFITDHVVSYDSKIKLFQERGDGKNLHIHIRIFRDLGSRMELLAEHKVDLRLYEPEEMEEMLRKAGFEVVVKLPGYCFRQWNEEAKRVIYVARKEGD